MERADSAKLAGLQWQVSQRCNGGECVRVADGGQMIFLGDTKNPSGPVFSYSRPQWQALITQIKRGDLDLF
jgi:hypothetical protein